jgi:hypothetical protein
MLKFDSADHNAGVEYGAWHGWRVTLVNEECTIISVPAACTGRNLLQGRKIAIAMSTNITMAAAAHMWLEAVRPACSTTCCHQQEHCSLTRVLNIGWYMDDCCPI